MVIYPSNERKFTITFQGDYKAEESCYAYTRGRSMLRVKLEDEETVTRVVLFTQAESFTFNVSYYTDPTGAVDIPLHNIISNLYGYGEVGIYVSMYPMDIEDDTMIDSLVFGVEVRKGVSYSDMLAPRNKDFSGTLNAYSHACILPPNVMINPNSAGGMTGRGIIVESNYHTLDSNAVWVAYTQGVGPTVVPYGERNNQLAIPSTADILRLATGQGGGIIKDYPLVKPDYCADLVCVRWTSLTGATRQHYFPVVAYIDGNGEQEPLVSPGDGYEVRKSNYKAVKCRLTGLTTYGYWYYMDMIQASDLHAVVQPTTSVADTEMMSAQTSAWVESDSMETPSGNGFFNFEFTVNMRQYGKV